jgi:hypothetical protein
VEALQPERVLMLPDGVEDYWDEELLELVTLAQLRSQNSRSLGDYFLRYKRYQNKRYQARGSHAT